MSMTEQTQADIGAMSFEQALRELETIVDRLEKGNVELEESIAIYERGERLRAHCDALLKQAEARVEKIVPGVGGAPPKAVPFDSDDTPF